MTRKHASGGLKYLLGGQRRGHTDADRETVNHTFCCLFHLFILVFPLPQHSYPDFMAGLFILIITAVVAIGAQCSSRFNSLFTVINITILLFVTIVGFVFADIENWTRTDEHGHGGFFPYGWTGALQGSAAAFWAFTGFEVLCVSIEEAKEPKKSIPRAIGLSILIATILYIGTAASITLVTSYELIDEEAPLPSAFAARGITWAKYIVSIGPLFGFMTTLLNSVYSSVRLTYAMADDGLLPPFLSWVSLRRKSPVITTLILGGTMCVLSIFMDLKAILGFSIVISLLQYAFIAVAVIILRYCPESDAQNTRNAGDKGPVYRSVSVTADLGTGPDELTPEREGSPLKINPLEDDCIKKQLLTVSAEKKVDDQSSDLDSEYDPSLDIKNYSTKNQSEELSREDKRLHSTGRFLPEDCEGDGFTTTEDEMVLFDARQWAVSKPMQAQKHTDVVNHSKVADIMNISQTQTWGHNSKTTNEDPISSDEENKFDSDQTDCKSASKESHCLLKMSTNSPRIPSGAGHLKARLRKLQPCFDPCETRWVPIATALTFIAMVLLSFVAIKWEAKLVRGSWWVVMSLCVAGAVMLVLIGSMCIFQQNREALTFKVLTVSGLNLKTLIYRLLAVR